MTDLEQIDEFLENYKKVSPKKYYSEAQINEMFVKDFMDYRRSIMMNEKLSARQKAMILAGMIGAGGLTGGLTSCAQPNTNDTNIEETNTMVNIEVSAPESTKYTDISKIGIIVNGILSDGTKKDITSECTMYRVDSSGTHLSEQLVKGDNKILISYIDTNARKNFEETITIKCTKSNTL